MQILSIKTKGDRSNPDERACVRECQRRGGTAWFSPFLAAQSLARHRRQRKESKGGGRERGAERGGVGSICKAGCESPQGEGRRGEDCAVEGELDPSQWLISLPAWSEWPRGLSPLRRRKDCRQEEEEEDCGSVEAPPGRLLAEGEEEGLGQAGMCQTCTHTRTHTNRG